MERYVLDSNIYIEMKNGPYGFDIVPGFWAWIEREAEAGYEPYQASDFLSGADPWVIAQALSDGSIVVTHEHRGGPGVKKVLIPNVCEAFDVRYVKIYDLLRIRGFRLGG